MFWRNGCPRWMKNRQGVGRDSGEMKPQEGLKRAFLPLGLAHTRHYGAGGEGDMKTLYPPETHGSIFTAKPDVFLSMDRSDTIIRCKL